MILMNMLKRLPIAFLLLVFGFFAFPNSSYAQEDIGDTAICSTQDVMSEQACVAIVSLFSEENNAQDGPWYNQNFRQFAKKVTQAPEEEIFGERYTYAQINWIINSIATMLNPAAGIDTPEKMINFFKAISDLQEQISQNKQPSIHEYAKLGPVGLFSSAMSSLYINPPASAAEETKSMAYKFLDLGTSPVNAQGYGYTSLTTGGAVHSLWSASRNMAYLIMTVLLVAAGFLIMFRIKINPQTVVSLQIMIPKLIATLLLVTFSFAIAGLIIDLIYVVVAAFVGILSMNGLVQDAAGLINNLLNRSFWTYMWLQIPVTILLVISLIVIPVAAAPFTAGQSLWAMLFAIIPILIGLWAIIILVKIFWMLLKAYVTLLLLISIGPLQIMLDLIPGQKGFGPWIRSIIANASVFATVPIMLVIQHIISGNIFSGAFIGTPDNLGLTTFGGLGGSNLTLPYMGANANAIVMWGVGFVIFSITPKVADMIRDALKIPAFKYGSAIGEAKANAMFLPAQAAGSAANYMELWSKENARDENRLARAGLFGAAAALQNLKRDLQNPR
jgi:hypothetical protein